MTPREIYGFLQLASRRLMADNTRMLGITALGAQGSGKDIKKQIEDWERES